MRKDIGKTCLESLSSASRCSQAYLPLNLSVSHLLSKGSDTLMQVSFLKVVHNATAWNNWVGSLTTFFFFFQFLNIVLCR